MNLGSKCISQTYFLLFTACLACNPKPKTDLADHNIIPHPVDIQSTGATFSLNYETKISYNDATLEHTANLLATELGGLASNQSSSDEGILLSINPEDTLGREGYRMQITKELITIEANHAHGVFNGVQSLLQIVPMSVGEATSIATGAIVDYPRYEYRGSMLDVSRHFFSVDITKRYIDYLAAYKFNVLHLHLTDDQGWRIEIKSRPRLTTIGATTEVGDGDGGFFTQEDYKEIVSYAAAKHITIIPEIDMPGHTQAALASYPELNCDGQAGELYRGIEVGFSTLCTRKEETYVFVEDVIQELAAITPGKYIHIGGDESHVTEKEDYIYFVNRVQEIVSKYDKIMIGWDEIAQGTIESGTIVQQWKDEGNALLAAENGNSIILSPATYTYLDMKYDSTTALGQDWAALIEVDRAYNWDPDTINSKVPEELILGVEAPLWTETIESQEDIDYMLFPRLPGYAEIGWSDQSDRVWSTYRQRLSAHGKRFEKEKINFYRSSKVDW